MAETFVLVHGAWQAGMHFETVAARLRSQGHTVHCPTLTGNRPLDPRNSATLEQAIDSLTTYITSNELENVRLVGHSYGGMVISGAADRLRERIRRLVYVNAFVPLSGECVLDLIPADHADAFRGLAAENDGAVMLPFLVWREAFVGDVDFAEAKRLHATLNAQPIGTFSQPIRLSAPIATLEIGKSYINNRQDISIPQSLSWHPRLSERLGLYRLVEMDGSHETMLSRPDTLADAIQIASRD
jgi:pimeloyl-ACP methyl ester carboxylesterase